MGTYTFCAIVCSVLRQTRFRLVHDLKWNIKSSLYQKISKNKFKKLFIGYPKTFNLLPTLSVYTWQINNLSMPKYKLENNSEREAKNKLNATSKRKVSKHQKKKKKDRHHKKSKHKGNDSQKHKSKSKISMTKRIELVLHDISSDNDSDIVIVYDSRKSSTNIKSQSNVSELLKNRNVDKTSGKDSLGSQLEKKEEKKTIITEIDLENYLEKAVAEFSVVNESHTDSCISEDREQHSSNFCGESSSKILNNYQDLSGSMCASRTSANCDKENRRWQFTKFGKKMAKSNEDVSTSNRPYILFDVLSYNVLCQEIMEEHTDLYTYNNPAALDWNYRSNLLMKEFIEFNSDVLCLQEVQQSHLKPFYERLENLGYTGLYKQRTGGKKDGVAIYFKTSIFDLIDHTTVEYYQPGVSVLNRDNVGLIVKLAPKAKPDERIIIATTHLLYNPRRHDVKLAQLQLLLAEVDRFAFKGIDKETNTHKYWPVVLTGDMNMEPNSGGFQLLTSGSFQYEGLSSKTLTSDFYGYGSALGKELVPQYLGVTDSCQHLQVVKNRHLQSSTNSSELFKDDHKSQEPLLQIYNSDFKRKPKPVEKEDVDIRLQYLKNSNLPKDFSSGQLSHDLCLSSVYQLDPFSYEKAQVSTFQNGWVIVDYIFYSDDGRCDLTKSQEGNLKLVARYKLFSEREASMVGPIPNLFSPSDHYPLAAKFALLF